MDHDSAKLMVKALMLFNDKPRFRNKIGNLESYEVAAEINSHLKAHGYDWLDTELQPPPRNFKR